MDALTIVVLVIVISLLAGALAWYGPRRRHWRTHHRGDAEGDHADQGSDR